MAISELNHELGNMDLYLIDQVLKGAFEPGMKILDAGCGEGRNIIYFLNNEFEVHGVDRNEDAIRMVRFVARSKQRDAKLFVPADVSSLPYPDNYFDVLISSAVLHFCDNTSEFITCIGEAVRVLRIGGLLFIRMTSDLGLADSIKPLENGKYQNPDGTTRLLLTRPLLEQIIRDHSLVLIEPYKSVVVDRQRSMATLVLRKS